MSQLRLMSHGTVYILQMTLNFYVYIIVNGMINFKNSRRLVDLFSRRRVAPTRRLIITRRDNALTRRHVVAWTRRVDAPTR